MIEANPLAYGKYAQASALADYLELLALKGKPLSESGLQDFINDNEWNISGGEIYAREGESRPATGEDESPTNYDPGAAARRVFALIRERLHLLRGSYPFKLKSSRVTYTGPSVPTTSPYVSLLTLTVAHAYSVKVPASATDVFEEIVTAVIASRGFKAVNLAGRARGKGRFEDLLTLAAKEVELSVDAVAAPRSFAAQDDKVDTIAHFSWADSRVGRWITLGQATCGGSENWSMKIKETSCHRWARFLCDPVEPVGFLAVPHHVEPRHLNFLVNDARRVVLDRVRLVLHRDGVGSREKRIAQAVLKQALTLP